ncbi:MAG: DUF1579 family protein [Anaerolineae bacterium]|nr:DUF1579 family protein [Anaerolineae bacterium]
MTELPPPNEHMQDLSWFIGEWDVTSRMLMDAGTGEWLEEPLHTVHTYEMGGHIIFEHFFGPLGGEPFEAWSLRKYNENSGKWEQRWVDTAPGGFANWIGSYADNQFIGYAMRFINDDGSIKDQTAYREVFDNITEDGFSWRFEQTEDGGATWTVTWTLEYVRAD